MAIDLERRIERLELAAQWRLRPEWHVIDAGYAGADAAAMIAEYEAATPESERAEHYLVINDCFSHVRAPVIASAAGSVAALLDPELLEGLTKQSARITNGN